MWRAHDAGPLLCYRLRPETCEPHFGYKWLLKFPEGLSQAKLSAVASLASPCPISLECSLGSYWSTVYVSQRMALLPSDRLHTSDHPPNVDPYQYTPLLRRDSSRDPHIKALKRTGFIKQRHKQATFSLQSQICPASSLGTCESVNYSAHYRFRV